MRFLLLAINALAERRFSIMHLLLQGPLFFGCVRTIYE
jgi:hypothetical protein